MLNIVKTEYVITAIDLANLIKIDGADRHDIFGELQDMSQCGGNESFAEIWRDALVESICDWGDIDIELTEKEILEKAELKSDGNVFLKIRCELLKMMMSGEIPDNFILLIWW